MQATKPTSNDQLDYSITVRFGSAVLEAGHTAIPNLVLLHYADLGVTTGELVFMTLCLQFKWSKGNPHPSLATIAERMNISRRQVRTYAAGLRSKGLLTVEERLDSERGQLSSVYDFTPFLEAVVKREGDDGIPPGKDPSYPARNKTSYPRRNDPSDLQEDKHQENKVMQSSRFTTFRKQDALAPAIPADNRDTVHPSPQTERREPSSLADIVRNRVPTPSIERAPSRPPKGGRYAERSYLDSLIRGISQIFNDDENTGANIIRAHRLQERAGLDEETFSQCVFRARSLVKERRLRHRGDSVRRPGAYFFTILEDLANEARMERKSGGGNERSGEVGGQDSAQKPPALATEPAEVHAGQLVPKRAL